MSNDYNKNLNQDEQSESGYTYVQGLGFVPFADVRKERSTLIINANAVGLSILLYLFLQVSLPPYIAQVFRLFLPQIRYFNAHLLAPDWVIQAVSGVSLVLCSLLAYGMYFMFIHIPLKTALPFKRPQLTIVVPAVFIALAVSIIGSLATATIGSVLGFIGFIPIMPAISIPTTTESFFAGLITLCILPAFLEEIIYRGVLMQSLRRFGDGFAVAISAVIFSMMHLNLVQAPIALLMGLVMGYFVIRTGSLWIGIIIHFFNNFVVMLQQMLTARLAQENVALIGFIMPLIYLVFGLISMLLLSHNTSNLFELKQSQSGYTARQRAKMFFSCPAMIIALVMIATFSVRNIQFVLR